MKKTSYFKEAMLLVTFVTTTLLIASCGNNQKPEDTRVAANKDNEVNFDNNKQAKDAQFLVSNDEGRYDVTRYNNKQEKDTLFLVNAAEISLEQIQLGQLAQQIGTTTDVKELGKMMEDANTKSLSDLTALAKRKMIPIPTSPTDNALDTYKALNEKSGSDFDKAYADMMVGRHKDAIAAFEKASADSNDTDIKNWATDSLSDLRKHLDLSIECQKKCDNL